MDEKQRKREITERVTVFLREKEGFLEQAYAAKPEWDDRDELALVLGAVNWHGERPGVLYFSFSV